MTAFMWNAASTVSRACTDVSANVALVNPSKGPFQLRIANTGSKTAFIRRGVDNTAAAVVATDMPVLAGSVEVVTVSPDISTPTTYMAAICAAGETTTLYFTSGAGE